MKYGAILLTGFILFGASICVLGWSKVYEESARLTPSSEDLQNKSHLPHYKVAILVPLLKPNIELTMKGFTDVLENEGKFTVNFRVYNPEVDRNRLRSYAEDIFNERYNLIYSIGLMSTAMLKEVSERRRDQTPIVFSNVVNPVQFGLVTSLERSENNLTGVPGDFENARYTHFLTILKKNMKKALIVYDPAEFGGAMEQYKKEVQKVLENKNIQLKSIEIFNVDEIPQKVAPHMGDIDMVITLAGIEVSGIKHLTKLCDMHHVPLASAGGLELAKRGVAISFGVHGYKVGTVAGHRALQILEQGISPTDIPISNVGKKWQMLLNSKAMKRQKLELNKNMDFLLKHTFVVGGKRL